MDSVEVLIIALALAVDAFAVALGAGVSLCNVGFRQTFRLAWHFGFFQAGMNIIGWSAGLTIRSLIASFDHWLAFGLLCFIGIRMIHEAMADDDSQKTNDPTRGKTLVLLSVATSIDALAVGLSFSLLHISIWIPALVIGVVATILTAVGLHLGCLVGSASRLGSRAEIIGGLVLVAIGVNILHEHGVF